MRNRNRFKRSGFTLVELLIVIVVIGVLSTMMMLSSTEAVTSAKVSNIVSNLRNLKTAALAYYTDNLNNYSLTDETLNSVRSDIFKYLSNANNIDEGEYKYYGFNNVGDKWYVWYGLNNDTAGKAMPQSVRDKLEARASSLGLLNGGVTPNGGKKEAAYTADGSNHWFVSLRVR